ncbi:acyl carrier protein [Thioalkalivibrio paradoxus]|uniref:Carrier domain-containing protein n=1 Tax=Thioalkalivibrio paradoxus ARh 1 TaxID=713585 RepID=W0DRP6_9GAMM|nr:acyl carrier protein [Thioalkalivibrio paradoxus]AHE99937.1 hypothetical protein THITH_04300 [Thioalkalivibrio paradoxus ARh 1]
MTHDTIREKVRSAVAKVMETGVSDLDDAADLYIDSVATMMLITELEEAFGIELGDADLDYEAFRTIEGITGFLGKFVPDQRCQG